MAHVAAIALDAEEARKPLKDRLHWYKLTATEYALLRAMAEHSWDGSVVNASLNRLVAYSKLSLRTVLRTLNGYADKKGLIAKRYISVIAPGNAGRRRSSTYRINESAMAIDPKMRPYLNRLKQQRLPISAGRQKASHGTTGTVPVVTCYPSGHSTGAAPLELLAKRQKTTGRVATESLKAETLKARNTSSATNAKIDRDKISEALAQIVPDFDQKALDRIIQGCLSQRPDAQTDEIVHFMAVRGRNVSRGRIENPTGYLIASLPECFAGEAFSEWRNRRASAVQAAVKQAQRKCLMCPNEVRGHEPFCSAGCERRMEERFPEDYRRLRKQLAQG